MSRVQQTQTDLEKQLNEQFSFLIDYADQYDAGKIHYAKQMATVLRVLLHDTGNSHSLLGQLGLKQARYFYDTATAELLDNFSPNFDWRNNRYGGQFLGILGMTSSAQIVSLLDPQESRLFFGFVPFDEYWNRTILVDGSETVFTRAKIITDVANQDGGSHVDPAINQEYHSLSRKNSMNIFARSAGSDTWRTMNDVALVCIRQITHEILRTFVIDYPKKEAPVPTDEELGISRAVFKRDTPITIEPQRVFYNRSKLERNNRPCVCKNNEKYKNCHGKHFDIY